RCPDPESRLWPRAGEGSVREQAEAVNFAEVAADFLPEEGGCLRPARRPACLDVLRPTDSPLGALAQVRPCAKPALISWVEEEADLWGPAARDPEAGACPPAAGAGDVLGTAFPGTASGPEPSSCPRPTPSLLLLFFPELLSPLRFPCRPLPPCRLSKKPYPCPDCGRCFRQSSEMAAHRRTHSGERPYPCPQCGRCFGQKSAMAKHQWVHRPGAGGHRGQGASVLPVPLASSQEDLDPPVSFQHYPEIFQECG
uniref:Zinc finger protein 764 n=1 Tax=Neovison vison TaxID=452646 RepID=A0A8C7C7Q2_NEOVI